MYLTTLGNANPSASRIAPRHLLFLTYLLMEGPTNRARLRTLFWPHSTSAAGNLRVLISIIRRTAPGLILERGDRLSVQCRGDVTDLFSYIQTKQISEAIKLYKEPFLTDMSLNSLGQELEEWLIDTRESIAEQLWEALVHDAETSLGQGLTIEATRHAEAAWLLPGLPPRDEHDLRRMHRLLSRCDSPHAGLVSREARSLGLEIGGVSSTEKLDFKPFPESRLPAEITPFFGHQELLENIQSTLQTPEVRLLTIFGIGGAGKTRLAHQVAQMAQQTYHSQVWWIALEDIQQSEDLLPYIARILGASLSAVRSPLDVLVTVLRERPALIVLDQFEHLNDAASIIAELLRQCPQLKVLVTSRQRLALRSETAFELHGLLVEARSGQAISDALALFTGQARRVRPEYRFTDIDLQHAQAVCESVDGLPLAIELTANWIGTLTPEAILGNLQAILSLPRATLIDLPERHRSMRLVLDQSWERLTSREQEVLTSLAVFHGGFTFAAAAAVVGATLHDLQGLIDTSMIRVDVTGRFSQHPLIAQLSRQYLSQNPVVKRKLEESHVAFFLERSNVGFYEQLDGQRQLEWQKWFHCEYPNLTAALESATDRTDYLSAIYVARNLHREWNNRGLAVMKLPTILALIPYVQEEPDAHVWGLITAEAFAMYSGTPPVGDAVAAARAAGDEFKLMCALYIREFAVHQRGDPEHAALMTELYAAAVKTGRPAPLAMMLRRHASVALAKGDGTAAQNDLERALLLAKQMGPTFNRADLHLLMGQLRTLRGQVNAAEQCFQAALHMFTTLGYRPHVSTCFSALALLHLFRMRPGHRAGPLEAALDYCERADETFSSEGRLAVRDSVNARGFVLSALNRLPEAQECFERDVRAARSSENRQGEHMARLGLGHLALRQHDWSTAQTIFAAIVNEADAADGHRPACWLALHGLAAAHFRLGRRHIAQTHWDEAQRLGQRLNAVLPPFLALPSQRFQRQNL